MIATVSRVDAEVVCNHLQVPGGLVGDAADSRVFKTRRLAPTRSRPPMRAIRVAHYDTV